MNLSFGVEVFEATEEFSADDSNMRLGEVSWFQLGLVSKEILQIDGNGMKSHTKSRQEPPPRYSITIHSLWPLRKHPLYCVTNVLAHVLRTAISP